MEKRIRSLMVFIFFGVFLLTMALISDGQRRTESGKYVSGDFHTHTYLTDGSYSQADVVTKSFDQFGLDWFANSEHGGFSTRDPEGNMFPAPLPRWYTLKEYSYPLLVNFRNIYPEKMIIQGLEWNCPSHEHASVGIVTDEPQAISDFEYMFDAGDTDVSQPHLIKQNVIHADAIAGAAWLQKKYRTQSYLILNHPSRKLKYSITHIRDMNNAAPDIFVGLEGMPGHQKEVNRGGYGNNYGADTCKARTYGGADYMIARVGGVWDALLGEGRKFFTYVNSDFHAADNDFWPGEYAKCYTWVEGSGYLSLVKGLKSGNSFSVHGDLINDLRFEIRQGPGRAVMGETLCAHSKMLHIQIKFKSPAFNNNLDTVQVDHIDLIAGKISKKAQPGTPEYNSDTNATTKIIARFTVQEWQFDDGYFVIDYKIRDLKQDMYFRLRGTNLPAGTEYETDADGNPLLDDLVGPNDGAKAYKDLWFYSNPIFVKVSGH